MTTPDAVLRFWFDETPRERRFALDPAFDAEIGRRFGATLDALAAGVPDAWTATPEGVLAAVVVLDQFPRNLFRGTARAFATDAAARALADAAIADGWDAALGAVERQFLYMPLMHSEDPGDQARAVAVFEGLGDPDAAEFARRHADVIARFGRFPSRNAALGRENTPAEAAFLAEGGAGF